MCIATSEVKRGLWECQEDFRVIRDELPSLIAQELDNIWAKIRDMAVSMCPVESGALASSIELESEGGNGVKNASYQGAEIYSNAIYAGNNETFNFDGQPTSQYAAAVHDGHMTRDGSFWEGCPFLEDALDAYESELDSAVDGAMEQLGIGDDNMPSTYKLGDETY